MYIARTQEAVRVMEKEEILDFTEYTNQADVFISTCKNKIVTILAENASEYMFGGGPRATCTFHTVTTQPTALEPPRSPLPHPPALTRAQ